MKQKLFTFLTLLVLCVTGAWAQTENEGDYSTQVISADGKTSTWTFITPSSQVNVPTSETEDNDIIYAPSGSSKMRFSSSNQFSWSGQSSGYIYVPAGSSGTISMTVKGSSDTRFLQLYIDGTNAGESYRLYSKLNSGGGISSDGKKGPQSFSFTSAQLTTKDSKTYLHFKDNNTEMKITSFTVTLTTGTYATGAAALTAPEISSTSGGTVTIGAVTNATKVTYTTDGTDPTATSTTYTAPFDVADGTTVKARAIGDGTNYSNSTVASKVVYYTGIKVATPVIKTYNGSVGITCSTPNATIKYSTDGGTTYNDYVRTFTLSANATLQAYAIRTDCTNSDEASAEVTIVSNGWNKTVYLPYTLFDVGKREGTDKNNLLTGKTGTVAEGYSIAITGRDDKDLQSGSNITVNGTSMQSMKVSNGAQNTLTIPAGVTVKGITFYSYNNYTDPTYVHGWKEVNGTSYQDSSSDSYYGNIPLQGNSNFSDYRTNPDSRTYSINNITDGGTITFTNAGNQICYLIGVHIVAPEYTVTYYGNGNDEGTAPVDEKSPYAEGTTVTVLGGGTLAKTGCEFTGWNTSADGNGTSYAVGATFNITGNTELYAQYKQVAGTAIIKATLTGTNTAEISGTIGGSYDVNVYAPDANQGGGCKFGGAGKYVGITLSSGSFKTGDIINVHTTTTAQQGTIAIYDTDKSTILYNTGVYTTSGTAGEIEDIDNKFTLPAAVNGKSTIYICRTSDNKWNGYVDFIEVTRPNAVVTLNAAGYATYSAASDFEVYSGAKAYKAVLNTADNKITCSEIEGKIPAGAGVLLYGDANAIVTLFNTTGATALEDNDLKGTTTASGSLATMEGSKFYYALSGDTFKHYTGAAFVANKAYFESDTELNSKAFTIVFDGETTGINAIEEVAPVTTKTRKVVKNGRLVIETANGEFTVSGARIK